MDGAGDSKKTFTVKGNADLHKESVTILITVSYSTVFFCLWRVEPIPGEGLSSRGFSITFIGDITFGRTPLDE
jgi:hypothetical protein